MREILEVFYFSTWGIVWYADGMGRDRTGRNGEGVKMPSDGNKEDKEGDEEVIILCPADVERVVSRDEVEQKFTQNSSRGTTRSTRFRRTKPGTKRLVSLRSVPSHTKCHIPARAPTTSELDSTVSQYYPLWASTTPSRFCFWELTQDFPVGHPSNSLNFGVPMEPEASELPKDLVLGRDENIHIRLIGSSSLGDVGSYTKTKTSY
ncbi:hypothetical protein DVH24_025917 [Malus domestica]|uniref:Uncharacterized protein n=1 Tax=Malus domestica TaxID=3750 RepID=A0A498KHY5_MALDO|nr:hypothetical protein DVH24_025917 [Malus domestica]